jgi:AraC-like DNA-binding protein
MAMTSSYQRCTATPIRQLVNAFWQTKGAPSYAREIILPKGITEIVFSFDHAVPFSMVGGRSVSSTPRCFLSGLNNFPIHLNVPQQQSFFGIELKPAAVKKLLKIPGGEFLNTITDIEELNKEFTTVWHQLAEAVSFDSRVAIIQGWLTEKLSMPHNRDMAVSDFLYSRSECSGVADLAAHFCYSSRQLNRKAQEFFGMSTEAVISYRRYLQALRLIHHTGESLTSISYSCNYFDQAHFIRDFKTYAGLTPGEYRKKKSHLAGHLYQ